MNEPELIKRCLNKEKEAWEIFIQKYSRLIYWAIKQRFILSSFAFTDDDANGVFQEMFLSLLESGKLSQVKDAKHICGWLAAAASNKTIDFMREKIRNGNRFVSDELMLENDGFEQELFDNDLKQLIKNIIDTLSAKEKIIISLNLLEERSHQEIAQILKIPINTVSTVIARTKNKLKQELEKRGIKD
jgi:RNA polymerase sigma-70 factor (ECF subfamily)